jgi:hypothetical protein
LTAGGRTPVVVCEVVVGGAAVEAGLLELPEDPHPATRITAAAIVLFGRLLLTC